MALPVGLATVTVTVGPYLSPDGTPLAGTVTFAVPERITHLTTGAVIVDKAATLTLDTDGTGSIVLPATDDPNLTPTDFTYDVTVEVGRSVKYTRTVVLPSASPTVDLDLLATTPASNGNEVLAPVVTNVEGLTGAVTLNELDHSLALGSSFAGGEDDGTGTDSTSRLDLESYQRAASGSFGETIRHYLRRGDAKAMEAWYFPDGGYDGSRNPVGTFKPVVWAGAHWEANDHSSLHKHWSVETPDSTGAIQTRFEVRFGNPATTGAIAGLDKTIIATNLADLVVRCSNGQQLRLSSPAGGSEKAIEFNHDYEGSTGFRRWRIRATAEAESTGNLGTNFQIARYDDAGTFVDNPVVISRATGNISLGPGLVARRSSSTVSSLSLNTTSLGSGIGVIAIGNANTTPSGTPSGGGVLYAEGGALKWKGSGGTVTTLGAA